MIPAAADFHRLDQRWRLRGVLTTRTALHIGQSPTAFDAIDMPVIKDARGMPLIPGSSIKGALRATIESLVRAICPHPPDHSSTPTALWSCDPLSAEACGYRQRGQDIQPARPQDDQPEQHCTVCRLFGAPSLASHVRFCDAMLAPSDRQRARLHPPVELRDGVSIDRDLGRAANARKYILEVVPSGWHFQLEVFIENPVPWLMGLLLAGFDQMDQGFSTLGGATSRGLGRVGLAWRELLVTTAEGLLAGQEPTRHQGPSLEDQEKSWRQQLVQAFEKGRA